MQDSEIKVENEEGQNPRLRKVNIPKQDFKTNKAAVRPLLDNEIAEQLKEVFELFSSTDRVNPYDIKNGLRSVSKSCYFIIIDNNFILYYRFP